MTVPLRLFLQRLTTSWMESFNSDYFIEKIRTIRNNFPPPNPTACPDNSSVGNPLLTFEPVTDEFVLKIINCAHAKSCELDPIPTTLLYENLDILHHDHQHISYHWHCTTWSDKNLLKNYRPISNHFCPKSLKKSFSTNFSPISKKATPFGQPIEQDSAPRPFCYVL